MSENKVLQSLQEETDINSIDDFKKQIELMFKGAVPVTTSFSHDIIKRMFKYVKANGLKSMQDLNRLAMAAFLNKAGY